MDLESKKTKIIFLIVSTILVVVFAYFSFAKKDEPEGKKSRTHSLKKGKDESNLEKSRRSASRNYERDVKDYSFNDYINDQKDGDATNHNDGEREEQEIEREKPASAGRNDFSRSDFEEEETVPVKKTPKTVRSAPPAPVAVAEPEPVAEIKTVQEAPKQQVRRTGFSGGGAKTTTANTSQVAIDSENIKAVVLQTKKIKSGDNILLRTTEQCIIEGRAIPENTLVAGIVTLSGSRLNIKVNAVAVGEESIVCKLNAYDLDGNIGLKMNKDISYEAKSESVGSVVGEVANAVNVPYIGKIATDVGTKVVSDPTVTLSQGQKMYLRTSN